MVESKEDNDSLDKVTLKSFMCSVYTCPPWGFSKTTLELKHVAMYMDTTHGQTARPSYTHRRPCHICLGSSLPNVEH